MTQAVEATPTWLDVGRLGRRRRARPHQPAHAREGPPGRARGRGRHQLLPEPAARLSRRHRLEPAAATRRCSRRPRTWTATPTPSTTSTMSTDGEVRRPHVRRRVGRRRRDALAAVLDAVGLARARRRRVRRRRRRRRGGRLLQRVPRRRRPGRAEARRRGRRRRATAASPTTSAWSTWPSTGVQGRGVLVDLAHHLGHDWRGVDRKTLEEIMAADNVVVEPGDMLLLHTGFATEVLEWNRNPDPVKIHTMCTYLDARDESLLRVDRRLADLRARGGQLRGRRNGRQGPRREPALVPADPPPLPLQARRPARRDVVPARARHVAARARPEPVPAHRAAAATARQSWAPR